MIRRIELTNFMSHEHTVIEPAAGLTVLVGPNNCGKSAIVAALQILCSNENSTYVMRHGARECSVKIETDDGHVVEWRRKNAPSYVIDGQTFDRLTRSGLPDELHAALRLPRVDAGDNTDFDVHFGTQKSPIFLLSGSAATSAKFFASSSDAIRLVAMQKRHKEKLANAQRDKNRLEAESKQVNYALGILEPVTDAGKAYDVLQAMANWVLAAETAETELGAQLATVHRHFAKVEVLRTLPPPPEIVPADRLQDLLAALLATERENASADARALALAKLPQPPDVAAIRPLQDLIVAIVAAESRRDETQSRTRILLTLQTPPALPDTSALDRLSADIVRLIRAVERTDSESRSLSQLSAPPPQAEVESLGRLAERLDGCHREVSLLRRKSTLLERVAKPPELQNELELARMLSEMAKAMRQARHWQDVAKDLDSVAPAPSLFDSHELCDAIDRLEAGSKQVGKFETAANTAARRVAEAAAELRAKAQGGLCPICGSPLDADRVMAHATTGLGGHEHG
jgi:exonuclease SbcC